MGYLTTLLNVRSNGVLTKLLIEFWDPTNATFRFLDFEITPTLEEENISIELPFDGKMSILPSIIIGEKFSHALVLRCSRSLRSIEDGWISLDHLFKIFKKLESYENH